MFKHEMWDGVRDGTNWCGKVYVGGGSGSVGSSSTFLPSFSS